MRTRTRRPRLVQVSLTFLGQVGLVVLSFAILASMLWGAPLWIGYIYVAWFLVFGVIMPIELHWILVGRPSWRTMRNRWRSFVQGPQFR